MQREPPKGLLLCVLCMVFDLRSTWFWNLLQGADATIVYVVAYSSGSTMERLMKELNEKEVQEVSGGCTIIPYPGIPIPVKPFPPGDGIWPPPGYKM